MLFVGIACEAPIAQTKPEPVDCVIYMQYDPDRGDEKTAYNKDIKASAEAVAGKTGAEDILEVNKKNTFDGVFLGIIKDNKCCKKIYILGHGTPDGSLQLPYDNQGADKLDDKEKGESGVSSVGGRAAKTVVGGRWLAHFVATIKGQKGDKTKDKNDLEYKDIPRVLCPDPETGTGDDKPTVTFDTCWAGKADDGVAEQVAKQGVQTEGWTGSCKFPYDEKTRTGERPRAGTGEEDLGSKLEKFERTEAKTRSGTKTGQKEKRPRKRVTSLYPERPVSRRPFTETTVVTGTDSETWCSYGDGVEMDTTLIANDEDGTPIEVTTSEETTTSEPMRTASEETTTSEEATTTSEATSEGTPATPGTPKVAKGPPEETRTLTEFTPETPKVTEGQPEQPPTTPETPKVTETPPKQPPSPSTTILYKVRESVMEGQPTGTSIENQIVKLFPTDEPDLPGIGSKEAEDTNFEADPVQGTSDANGEGKMQVPMKDRALYGLPSADAKSSQYYRLDYDLPQQSGGVVETTGKDANLDLKTGTPAGAEVTAEYFKIGNRTYVRLIYQQPYGLHHDFREQFARAYGPKYEEDICRGPEPAPPLGLQSGSLSALNHDLPQATVNFEGAQ